VNSAGQPEQGAGPAADGARGIAGGRGGHRSLAGSRVSETELMHHRWSVGTG
jgi:hypothetical protein